MKYEYKEALILSNLFKACCALDIFTYDVVCAGHLIDEEGDIKIFWNVIPLVFPKK